MGSNNDPREAWPSSSGGCSGSGSGRRWRPTTIQSIIPSPLPSSLPSQPPNPSLPSHHLPQSLPLSPATAAAIQKTAPPTVTGTIAFYATLALSTLVQKRVLGVSTGTVPPIPTLLGIGSVAAASLVGQRVGIETCGWMEEERRRREESRGLWGWGGGWGGDGGGRRSMGGLMEMGTEDGMSRGDALRVAALGLLTFKVLTGRYWSISPSSYTNLGSFARPSIASLPATMNYATPTQRSAIERFGRRFGCHTCGSRMILSRGTGGVKFHSDHMPPKAVAEQMNRRLYRRLLRWTVKQRFYPQCTGCSGVQGGILSRASGGLRKTNLARSGGGRAAYDHGLRFRMHHLAGGVVAGTTVYGANVDDVLRDGNARRFRNWQASLHGWVGDLVGLDMVTGTNSSDRGRRR